MKSNNKQTIYFTIIISALAFYICDRSAALYQNMQGNPIIRITETANALFSAIQARIFFIAFDRNSVIAGLVGVLIVLLFFLYNFFNQKNLMPGIEHGSAEWGSPEDIKELADLEDFKRNIILTNTEKMSLDTQKTFRNNNVLVVGGSGSGKTRFFLKPNLMQMHTSYVVTDPKGTVLPECGRMLQNHGYKIRVFNTINFKKSMHYNPFAYIREERDILNLVHTIMVNTEGEGEQRKEDFWDKAERLLYHALIGYIWYEAPEEEKNFDTLLLLLNQMAVREDDESFKSPVDVLLEDLAETDPEHFAVRQYKKFKQAAGKTAKSILISCGARLSPFDIKALRELTAYDELELDTVGDERTALFIIVDDKDTTFNFIVAILYTQLFNELCNKADNEYGGRLPFHVRCLLDEFANIGQIPNFEKLIATIRSREISACPLVQNIAQIKAIYKDQAGTIVGNCDTMLFLGSNEEETQKSISARVGKTTVDHTSVNESRGTTGSYSLNQHIIARDLITPAEVGLLAKDDCLLFIRGVKPFKSKKYEIKNHTRYVELSDWDQKNTFHYAEEIIPQNKQEREEQIFFDNVWQVLEVPKEAVYDMEI